MVYTDKDVRITGYGSLGTYYNLSLKRGWNPVYVWKTNNIRNVSQDMYPYSYAVLYGQYRYDIMVEGSSEWGQYDGLLEPW